MDILSDQQVEGLATVLHTGLKHNKREQGTLVAFTNRVLQPPLDGAHSLCRPLLIGVDDITDLGRI